MMTKDEFFKSLAADFFAAVESTYQDLIKAAVLAEREACAKLCLDTEPFYGVMFANAIRARGNIVNGTRTPAFISCDAHGNITCHEQ